MWKHITYIKKGLSHEEDGTDCQDSVQIHEDEYCIVAALADGLGSLKYSALASKTATETACRWLSSEEAEELILNFKEREDEFRAEFSATISAAVKKVAEDNKVSPKKMDCTLAFVYLSKVNDFALVGMIGDSAVCIITEDKSVAITDSGTVANGTRAVQDRDAGEHMKLRRYALTKQKVLGFILTSDGMDNEIYIKGSTHVNQVAGEYFNALVDPNPYHVLEQLVEGVTCYEDTPYDDDISIAIVSRAETAVELEKDPTWLCTCGCRNVMQDTYCVECNQDFTKLYSNVRFREYGGKAAFFKQLNESPEEERKMIGLPSLEETTIAVQSAEPTEGLAPTCSADMQEQTGNREEVHTDTNVVNHFLSALVQDEKNLRKTLALAAAIVLAVGAIGGMIVGRLSAKSKINRLESEKAAKEQIIESLGQEADGTDVMVQRPENFVVLNNGNCYWGELDQDLPNGKGILEIDGDYYIGSFAYGFRNGTFAIIPDGDPAQLETAVYSMGLLEQEEEQRVQIPYVVVSDDVNIRDLPGTENTGIIDNKSKGETVIGTGETRMIGDAQWAEIYWEDGKTAWILLSNLQEAPDVPEETKDTKETEATEDPTVAQYTVYVVKSERLNVRNQPGTEDTKIIGAVKTGDQLRATGNEKKVGSSIWIEILWEDGTGWVASTQLEKQS